MYNYLIYRLKAVNQHGVHSPFVYDLLLSTVYNRKAFYAYGRVEEIRHKMLASQKEVSCVDLGAGSRLNTKVSKSVREIANISVKPTKYAQLLFRLVDHFQPLYILELGTSLGVTASYLAIANSKAKLITIEGCEDLATIAKQNFKKLELENISQKVGNFDEVLPAVLKPIEKLDFVFIDGNHRKEATLSYFKQCLEKANESSVFVFDDIYWSAEMQEAWCEIKNHKRVTVSLDLFCMGIVFFRKEQVKEHFVIRY